MTLSILSRMSTVGAAKTLPWSWYTDPAVLELEHARVFGRFWQYVGRTDEVGEPGSYSATRAGRVPVVLVRDRERVLRAFLNVCRHRGSIVCSGSGKRETLQCPYHAWTYGLDGALLSAPRSAREGGIDRDELGLVQLRLETWGPFVFVNPDPDAPPLEEFLEDIPDRIADAGVDVDTLAFHSRADREYEANWKICVENYLECYHCPVAHPGFSAVIDVSPDNYLLETHRWRTAQIGPTRPEPRGAYDPTGEVERGQFHFLFPNTALNVNPGHPNLSIGPIVPIGPERTYRFLDYFFDPAADQRWIDEYMAFDTQVGIEDTMLVENVQAGVRSGLIEHGRLMPESERLVSHFQSLVLEALA
jgi:phenylpropionate dioxygenase-like ring-hydroxylating dioxygenase large terminal subunit